MSDAYEAFKRTHSTKLKGELLELCTELNEDALEKVNQVMLLDESDSHERCMAAAQRQTADDNLHPDSKSTTRAALLRENKRLMDCAAAAAVKPNPAVTKAIEDANIAITQAEFAIRLLNERFPDQDSKGGRRSLRRKQRKSISQRKRKSISQRKRKSISQRKRKSAKQRK